GCDRLQRRGARHAHGGPDEVGASEWTLGNRRALCHPRQLVAFPSDAVALHLPLLSRSTAHCGRISPSVRVPGKRAAEKRQKRGSKRRGKRAFRYAVAVLSLRAEMEFRILGPFEVWSDEGRLPLGGSQQRMLLAILLLRRNEVVSIDRLVDELWTGGPPATAVKVVQVYVSRLRKALGGRRTPGDAEDVLITRAHGYLLRVGPDELDSERFELLVEEGKRALGA